MRRSTGIFPDERLELHREVGALDAEAAALELDIGGRNFERVRREVEALADHLARGERQRAPVRHHRARSDGARPHERRAVGIARAQDDLVRVQTQQFRDDLRKHRLVPLPRRPGKRVEERITRVPELDERLLFGRDGSPRGLDEHGAGDAAQLPAPGSFGTPRLECAPPRMLERAFQLAGRIAAVVIDRSGLIRKRCLRYEIAPAQLDAVDPRFARGRLHQALDEVRNVGTRRPAVGGRRRGIGQDQAVTAVHHGNAIGVDRVRDRRNGIDHRPGLGQVRARVDKPIEAHGEEAAVAVERKLAGHVGRARMVVAHEGLCAR